MTEFDDKNLLSDIPTKNVASSSSFSTSTSSSQLQKIVYVPTGHCGRLITSVTPIHGITGLYTDNFTSSVIVICLGQERLSITHLDFQNHIPHSIKQQITWTSGTSQSDPSSSSEGKGKSRSPSCRLVLYSRKPKGEPLKKILLQYLEKRISNTKNY